jgi:hypothetical protein
MGIFAGLIHSLCGFPHRGRKSKNAVAEMKVV